MAAQADSLTQTQPAAPFQAERLGIIMQPEPGNPHEAWGTLNPGGVRGPDGAYYLFPRVAAEGNYSRIGHARVRFDALGIPRDVERLGYALEPEEPYEVTGLGGGVEDPRVTYVQPLGLYVMAYTAFTPPHDPRIALAVSSDLVAWTRLGPLHFTVGPDGHDHNLCGNKDGAVFPDVVRDPNGQRCLAILHRPTYAVRYAGDDGRDCCDVTPPPKGGAHPEDIWISYVPLERVRANIRHLTSVEAHRPLMSAQAPWESRKIGAGAPPVRLPDGWLLVYHGVSMQGGVEPPRYAAGVAVLDVDDPTLILYRSPQPILEPKTPQETQGIVANVVFPTAVDLRNDGHLDLYYGAGDYVTAAARLRLPPRGVLMDDAAGRAR